MKPTVLAAIAAALMLTNSICAHAADSGFYLGGGIGEGTIRVDPANPNGAGNLNFDSDATSYKLFAGYRFAAVPFLNLALEAGYIDFGKPSQTSLGQRIEYKLQGADATALAIVALGPVDLYGKLGTLYWNADRNIGGVTASKTGTNAFYGFGVGLRIGALGLRAEYERFDAWDLDRLEMYSLSALIQF